MKRGRHRKESEYFTAGRNECGKVAFGTRKQAKRAEQHLPGKHVRPYRCPTCDLFHLGHLPVVVRLGEMSADEWYGQPGQVAS